MDTAEIPLNHNFPFTIVIVIIRMVASGNPINSSIFVFTD